MNMKNFAASLESELLPRVLGQRYVVVPCFAGDRELSCPFPRTLSGKEDACT